MEVFADSKELARAVNHVIKTVGARDLSAMRLVAQDGKLAVSAAGNDRWSRSIMAAEVMEPGETLVGAARFDAIVRVLPAGEIRVETDEEWVTAGGDGARLRLRRIDPDAGGVNAPQDPSLPEMMHTIDTDGFSRMVDAVSGACSSDPARPMLQAVHLTVTDGWMRCEATDQNFASRMGMRADGMPDGDWIIPGEWLKTTTRTRI